MMRRGKTPGAVQTSQPLADSTCQSQPGEAEHHLLQACCEEIGEQRRRGVAGHGVHEGEGRLWGIASCRGGGVGRRSSLNTKPGEMICEQDYHLDVIQVSDTSPCFSQEKPECLFSRNSHCSEFEPQNGDHGHEKLN